MAQPYIHCTYTGLSGAAASNPPASDGGAPELLFGQPPATRPGARLAARAASRKRPSASSIDAVRTSVPRSQLSAARIAHVRIDQPDHRAPQHRPRAFACLQALIAADLPSATMRPSGSASAWCTLPSSSAVTIAVEQNGVGGPGAPRGEGQRSVTSAKNFIGGLRKRWLITQIDADIIRTRTAPLLQRPMRDNDPAQPRLLDRFRHQSRLPRPSHESVHVFERGGPALGQHDAHLGG